MGPQQTKNLLHSKRNHQNEDATYGTGKDICKLQLCEVMGVLTNLIVVIISRHVMYQIIIFYTLNLHKVMR